MKGYFVLNEDDYTSLAVIISLITMALNLINSQGLKLTTKSTG